MAKQRGEQAITVALVNDYELVVKGLATMLTPFRSRLAVIELDVDVEPTSRVDVALFDAYGQPHLGLDRLAALVRSRNVGAVAVYTSSADPDQRRAALQVG